MNDEDSNPSGIEATIAQVISVEFPLLDKDEKGQQGSMRVRLSPERGGKEILFEGNRFVDLFRAYRLRSLSGRERWEAVIASKPDEIILLAATTELGWKLKPSEINDWADRAKVEYMRIKKALKKDKEPVD